MLSYKTIEPHTLELLRKISDIPVFSDLRLVGGTSLALQYGHRTSIDLDFFGEISATSEEIRSALVDIGELQIIKETDNIKIYRLDGIKVDIVNYPYRWIDAPISEDGLSLASAKDIAAMKINAIEGRGTKKDFIDVHELLKYYSLDEILIFHKQKYPEASTLRSLMSLAYFEDAELQPMPLMFTSETWEQIKSDVLSDVKNYHS